MKIKLFSLMTILMLFLLIILPYNVQAQEQPYIFHTTIPVDADLRTAIDAWLIDHNPSIGIYYAITYAQALNADDYYVSIASFDLVSPEDAWSMTEDVNGISRLIWFGTVHVSSDLTVELLTETQSAQANEFKTASLTFPTDLFAAGGGPEIRLPFQTGRTAMYGPAGVHAAGYTTYGTGMVAIDWVGGSDFGSGGTNDSVYASAAGTVDYVCADDTSVMVRVNDGAGNKFIYAHLLDNATLVLDQVFAKSAVIGTLVHGSFTDDCGNTSQQDNHWHVHWGFVAANNSFRFEGCTVNTTTNTISCGDRKINPGGFLASIGGIHGSDDNSSSSPTFWDYLLVGFVNIFDQGIIKLMPEHTSPTLLPRTIFNILRFMLKITYALLVSNFNLGPAMIAIFAAITFRTLTGAIWLVAVAFRSIKMIPTL